MLTQKLGLWEALNWGLPGRLGAWAGNGTFGWGGEGKERRQPVLKACHDAHHREPRPILEIKNSFGAGGVGGRRQEEKLRGPQTCP